MPWGNFLLGFGQKDWYIFQAVHRIIIQYVWQMTKTTWFVNKIIFDYLVNNQKKNVS